MLNIATGQKAGNNSAAFAKQIVINALKDVQEHGLQKIKVVKLDLFSEKGNRKVSETGKLKKKYDDELVVVRNLYFL